MSCTVYVKDSSYMSEVADASVQLVLTTPTETGPCAPYFKKVMRGVKRVLKEGGFLVINVGVPMTKSCLKVPPSLHPYKVAELVMKATGLNLVWNVIGTFNDDAGKFPTKIDDKLKILASTYECWLIFAKGDYHFKMLSSDALRYPVTWFEANAGAVEWVIRMTASAGDLVVDPFAGSGTTGLVANNLGCPCILYEIKPERARSILHKIPHAVIVEP